MRSSTLTPHEANSTVGSLAFRQNRYYRQNAYDFNLLLKFASISEFQIHFFSAAFTHNKVISILPFLNIRPRMVRNLIFSTSLVASFDTQSAEKDVPQVNMIMRGMSDFPVHQEIKKGWHL